MKKLTTLLLLMLFSGLSNAQTTKPTVEETVQYIKNELQGHKHTWFYDTYYPGGVARTRDVHLTYTDMKIESCILSWKKNWTRRTLENGVVTDDKPETVHLFIDFSKVESLATYEHNGTAHRIYFHIINTDGSKREESILIDNAYVSPIIDNTAYSSKIYKAFQHLRKLCGAPEPISFD